MTEANQTGDNTGSTPLAVKRKPIRWWPAVVLLLLAVAVIVGIRLWPKTSFQEKNIATARKNGVL